MLTNTGVTGTMAADISAAASGSTSTGLILMITGTWLMLWAGRSLAKVLAASAGRSWQLDPKTAKATLTAMGALTAVLAVMIVCTIFLNRIRDRHGLAADTTSWMLTLAMISLAWFAVSWFLPRATPDPGALLPGAAFVGATLTVLQWFMQFYLPSKVSRSSDLTGQLGITMAALGYLFLIGRAMVTSFVINAVMFERLGSLSRLVFALPLVRVIPRRYGRIARFFDLPGAPPAPVKGAIPAPDVDRSAMM
jgi:Virulence factor BrkB